MAKFLQRSADRAVKFGVKLAKILDKASIDIVTASTVGADAILNATAKFLASFGSETIRLIKLSKAALNKLDSIEQMKLKTRAIEELQAQSRSQLQQVFEDYARGRIEVEQFKTTAQDILRQQALAAAIVGVGGLGNLTENILTAVQRQLTIQFQYLDGFIEDIESRDLTNKDRARIQQYALQAHTISQTANRQFQLDTHQGQELEERRRLGSVEHCEDCLSLSEEGWSPAGTLPPIGQGTVCGNHCQCWIQVRVKQEEDLTTSNSIQDI